MSLHLDKESLEFSISLGRYEAKHGHSSGHHRSRYRGQGKAAKVVSEPLSREQRVRAKYRLVASHETDNQSSGISSIIPGTFSAPSIATAAGIVGSAPVPLGSVVQWRDLHEIIVDCDGSDARRFKCPICLERPRSAVMSRCGHVYCWVCWLQYAAGTDAGKVVHSSGAASGGYIPYSQPASSSAASASTATSSAAQASIALNLRPGLDVRCPVCGEWVDAHDCRHVTFACYSSPMEEGVYPCPPLAKRLAMAAHHAGEDEEEHERQSASSLVSAPSPPVGNSRGVHSSSSANHMGRGEDPALLDSAPMEAYSHLHRLVHLSSEALHTRTVSSASAGHGSIGASAGGSSAAAATSSSASTEAVYSVQVKQAAKSGAAATSKHGPSQPFMCFRLVALCPPPTPLPATVHAAGTGDVQHGLLATAPVLLQTASAPLVDDDACAPYARVTRSHGAHYVRCMERVIAELQSVHAALTAEQQEAASCVNAMIIGVTDGPPAVGGGKGAGQGTQAAGTGIGAHAPASAKGAWGDKLGTRSMIQQMGTVEGSGPGSLRSGSLDDVLVSAGHEGAWYSQAEVFGLNSAAMEVVTRQSELASQAARAQLFVNWAIERAQSRLQAVKSLRQESGLQWTAPDYSSDRAQDAQEPVRVPVQPLFDDNAAGTPVLQPAVLLYQSLCGEMAYLQHDCLRTVLGTAELACQGKDKASASAHAVADATVGSTDLCGQLPEWDMPHRGLPPVLAAPILGVESVRCTTDFRKKHEQFKTVPLGALLHFVEVDIRQLRAGIVDGFGHVRWWYIRVPRRVTDTLGISAALTARAQARAAALKDAQARATKELRMTKAKDRKASAGSSSELQGGGLQAGGHASAAGRPNGSTPHGSSSSKHRARILSQGSASTTDSLTQDILAASLAAASPSAHAHGVGGAHTGQTGELQSQGQGGGKGRGGAAGVSKGKTGKNRTMAEAYKELMGITHVPDDPTFLAGLVEGAEGSRSSLTAAALQDTKLYPSLSKPAKSAAPKLAATAAEFIPGSAYAGHVEDGGESPRESRTGDGAPAAGTSAGQGAAVEDSLSPHHSPQLKGQKTHTGWSFKTITDPKGGYFPSLNEAMGAPSTPAAAGVSSVPSVSPSMAPAGTAAGAGGMAGQGAAGQPLARAQFVVQQGVSKAVPSSGTGSWTSIGGSRVGVGGKGQGAGPAPPSAADAYAAPRGTLDIGSMLQMDAKRSKKQGK